MRKTALTLTVSTLVLGIFGAFLRWLQTMSAFDKETGFPIPGAGTTKVFLLYSVLAAAAFILLALLWLRRFAAAPEAGAALRSGTMLPSVLGWALCVCFAAAACYVLFRAGSARQPNIAPREPCRRDWIE